MRKISLIVLTCFFSLFISAQVNLVPNPSFEDTISCPSQDDEAANCQFWSSYRTSPDYYNSCNTFSNSFSTPYNLAGFQIPAHGGSYMGVILYGSPTVLYANYREYLGAKLTSTLVISQKYFFSIKYVATKSNWAPSNCYSNKLGVNFSKTSFSVLNPYPIINSAKVFGNTIINDTVNWQTIKGSFIADSAYQYLIIGNFFNDLQTDTLIFDSNTNCTSYYLIDNVCLSTDSAFAYNYIATKAQIYSNNNSNIKVFPNPASTHLYIEGNIINENYLMKDVYGTIVKKGVLKSGLNPIEILELMSGIYFLELKDKKIKVLINN